MYFNTVVIHSDNSNYHSFLFIAGIVNPTPNPDPDSHPEPYVEDGKRPFYDDNEQIYINIGFQITL